MRSEYNRTLKEGVTQPHSTVKELPLHLPQPTLSPGFSGRPPSAQPPQVPPHGLSLQQQREERLSTGDSILPLGSGSQNST